MMAIVGKDTRTRYQGVFARHRKGCAVERGARCNCNPGYYGRVYDRQAAKQVRTPTFATVSPALHARRDLVDRVRRGELPARTELRVQPAVDRFLEAARTGVALNKNGRRYKRTAIKDLDNALHVHVIPAVGGRRLTDVRRRDVQAIIDSIAPRLSGSRVRSVVNAIRSLYRWAQDREMCDHNPAGVVRLPAMAERRQPKVVTPAELAALLDALELDDALPYALAAYGSGRRSEITHLPWGEVDVDRGVVLWGTDEQGGQKSQAARRVFPIVRPLAVLLRRAYLAQGRPHPTELVCPPRKYSRSGELSSAGLAGRAHERWEPAGLDPVGLQDCRHTAASWLDAAGVNPKLASELMGHSTPGRQPGAAPITLARYTHTLPGDLERARDLLDGYLARETPAERETDER